MNITDFIFDAPYWLMVVLGILGLVLLYLGNQRQNKPLTRIAVGALGVGVLLLLMSLLVETPKKQVARRTKELVAAVVAADASKLRSLLDPKANAYGMNTDAIIQAACSAATDSMVQSVTITSRTVTQDASGIISNFDCFAQFKPESTVPTSAVPTSWQLYWAKSPNQGWVIYDIKCTRMGTQDASMVVQYLLSHRIFGSGK